MTRIIRLNKAMLVRMVLLFLLAVAAIGGLLIVHSWLTARGTNGKEAEQVAPSEPEEPDLAAVSTPAGVVHLKRALFCLDVHNRKPVVVKSVFNRRVDYIYCYSVLSAPQEGVTILHRWILDGQPVFERRLRAQGKNCRVWSRRHLLNKTPGSGRVEIVVEDGNTLGAAVFTLI